MRGPDRKPRKGSPRRGRKGRTRPDESPSRARKARAIALLVEGHTPDEVAGILGVGRSTVYAWLQREDFAAQLDARLGQVQQAAVRFLRSKTLDAARSLATCAASGERDHGPRVKAATEVLALAGVTAPSTVNVNMGGGVDLRGKDDDELEDIVARGARLLRKPPVAEEG